MDIYINPLTNDIDLTNNKISLVKTEEQLTRQRLSIALNTFMGEWFANRRFGVPYLENNLADRAVLSKSSLNVLDFEVKKVILNTEGITSLVSYRSEVDRIIRKVTIQFSAITESGVLIEDQFEV